MTGRRRHGALGGWVPLGAVCIGVYASPAQAAPQRRDTGPLFTPVDTGQGAAATARALAAKGDCAHALASFDIALRSTIDMTIRRDRGLCHEALGNAFPAMDDYRAYLTVSPDAADADDIRARLERLETQTGVGGPSTVPVEKKKSAEDVPDEPAQIGDVTIQTSDTGKRTKEAHVSYEAEEDSYHKYDQAMTSPLRRGTGAIFGAYGEGLALGFGGNAGIGGGEGFFTPGFEIGVSVRWYLSQVSGFNFQLGYVNYEFEAIGTTEAAGGVALSVAYEARIRLDQYATHAIVLGPAFEYQYISEAQGGGANIMIPEGRVGYRVILGYGVGLELVADAGFPIFAPNTGGIYTTNYPIVGGTGSVLLAF
jgi:hypothetical protein